MSAHIIPAAPLTHAQAMALQRDELQRIVALLAALRDDEWILPTDCPAWDVRRLSLHLLGACEAGASTAEMMRQMRRALARRRREGGPLEAAISATQVEARDGLHAAEIVAQLRATAPACVKGRQRTPSFVRERVSMKVDGPVVERWRFGYLLDTIYLRDLWLHRVDLCRATGRDFECTAEHDGVVVADVVREWAVRHGAAYRLVLAGPAGGEFASDDVAGGPTVDPIEIDAVEFCRTVGGRVAGQGLLATVVPF